MDTNINTENLLLEINRKLDLLVSEKTINESPSMVIALTEAKKGNYKALQLAAKLRFEQKAKQVGIRKS